MPQNIKREDVQTLSNPDAVATFFLKLGYDIGTRVVSSAKALDITGDVSHAIKHVERIASLNDGYEISVYLFQLQGRSVTMTAQKAISRAFRDRSGDFLMVLTTNYVQIDFMLVERSDAEAGMTQKEIIGSRPPVHRVGGTLPRFLTVNRSNPGSVALRVLRLFSYTPGKIVFEQSERLRNAYDVAYWSEEYFNNRALFSDYYLKERLPEERADWRKPDSRESTTRKRVQGALSRLYDDAQDEYANKSVQEVRSQLIEPVLRLLGFTAQETKAKKGAERTADYTLYATDTLGRRVGQKPLAVCLAYRWQRDLDRQVDEREDPETADENPGAVVVTLLDKGEADWAILTNGKTWRLYAAKAHSRATNYYEIDLEDIVVSNVADREEAFKYFWFLFRYDSFLPTEDNGTRPFVDALLNESEQYARRLGDRLKNRIFEDVFHHFAQGFVNYAQKQNMLPTKLDSLDEQERERRLKPYFDGTLTFLYRLLFLLYAESRNLLPVHETDSYYQVSLEKLKNDIKENVGESVTDAPERIRFHYDSKSTTLYDSLKTVFHAVDKGDKDLNVPIYNGGLFMTEPHLLDTSAEAEVAQFLRTHKIPDQYLALGFDLMARDEDDKKSGLVFVDYKSLGVRQLGSIYEGLLEFKLRVATQAMTVVKMEKNKKTEKIVPYEEARAKRLAIVKERHEGAYRERVYNLNDVYLENDRSERKATGSYYTPDYIVKYIVQNTVGPVLEQKLEALRKTFEEAEKTLGINKQRNKALEQQKLKAEDAEEKTYQHYEHTLNEQFFDLKVLDPAMGSGHFLVEAVDFITDKMTRFLEGFPWNPVVYHLGKIREDIQREMEEQDIAIDVSKLTNINLLKRQVLKRCIYGVDLNPMAVELAKVSVWLDSFTLGAPLSFLDHHLKCGNSLIGARIDDAKQAVEEGQLSLFFGSTMWASVALATGGALEVARMSDSTAGQVQLSKMKNKESEEALAPYKRLLNVYLSRWFSNIIIKGKKGSADVDKAIDFLRSPEAEKWYQHPEQINGLTEEQKKIVEIAQQAAENHHFFHWEMEFPDVYFGPMPGAPQTIELKVNAGFDAVIGNPPYVSAPAMVTSMSTERKFLETYYKLLTMKWDLYCAFVELFCQRLTIESVAGFIVPSQILYQDYAKPIRRVLLEKFKIEFIADFSHVRVFSEAIVMTCVMIVRKPLESLQRTNQIKVVRPTTEISLNTSMLALSNHFLLPQSVFHETQDITFRLDIPDKMVSSLGKKIAMNSYFMGEICYGSVGVVPHSEKEGKAKEHYLYSYKYDNQCKPYIEGKEVDRYVIDWKGRFLKYNYNVVRRPSLPELLDGTKIILKIVAGKSGLNATVDYSGFYVDHSFVMFTQKYRLMTVTTRTLILDKKGIELSKNYQLEFLLSIINSTLMGWYFQKNLTSDLNIGPDDAKNLPIHYIKFSTPNIEREAYKDEGKILYGEGANDNNKKDVLGFAKLHLEAEQSDVVHDLLVFLAEEMLRLNKEKRDEQQRFLADIVKLLKVRPDKDGKEGIDALVGKQRVVEYPGEYQKGTPELGFDDLFDLLYKNKTRLGIASLAAMKDTLRIEYEKSVKVVRPLVKQLKYTDELIDSVVYALYGLTQDEIDVVEGKGRVVDSNV